MSTELSLQKCSITLLAALIQAANGKKATFAMSAHNVVMTIDDDRRAADTLLEMLAMWIVHLKDKSLVAAAFDGYSMEDLQSHLDKKTFSALTVEWREGAALVRWRSPFGSGWTFGDTIAEALSRFIIGEEDKCAPFVKVLADSIHNGNRILTIQATFWRSLLAEFNTHRMLSKSSESSRAVPFPQKRDKVQRHPFVPLMMGKNKGMQPGAALTDQTNARAAWLRLRDAAVHEATIVDAAGVHKSYANRLIEPFMHHTAILTGTEWENIIGQRTELNDENVPMAQKEFYVVAKLIEMAIRESVPMERKKGEWHLPMLKVDEQEQYKNKANWNGVDWSKVSGAKCGRTSYLTHDKGIHSIEEDLALAESFPRNGHWSPLEHPAFAVSSSWNANLYGWMSLRNTYPGEAIRKPKNTNKNWPWEKP